MTAETDEEDRVLAFAHIGETRFDTRRDAGLCAAEPRTERPRRRIGRRLARERHPRHPARTQPERAAQLMTARDRAPIRRPGT